MTAKTHTTISRNLPTSLERKPANVVPDFTEDEEKNTERDREKAVEALLRLDEKWFQTMFCSSPTQPHTAHWAGAAR